MIGYHGYHCDICGESDLADNAGYVCVGDLVLCKDCYKKTVESDVIDKVLEIIDEIEHDIGHVALIGDDNKFVGVLCNSSEFRDRVLVLKEGEQE